MTMVELVGKGSIKIFQDDPRDSRILLERKGNTQKETDFRKPTTHSA